MDETLLPCPFCRSSALDAPQNRYQNPRQVNYFLAVSCRDCGGQGPDARVVQLRKDGEPYCHGSRRPASAEGRERWQNTIAQGAREARRLWNERGNQNVERALEKVRSAVSEEVWKRTRFVFTRGIHRGIRASKVEVHEEGLVLFYSPKAQRAPLEPAPRMNRAYASLLITDDELTGLTTNGEGHIYSWEHDSSDISVEYALDRLLTFFSSLS